MFHSGTSALIEAWSALPDAGRVPARSDFAPLSLGPLVPQLWSADRLDGGVTRIRLAGAGVERLHGRPLADLDWMTLWGADSRPMVAAALAQAFREARPVVLCADSPLLNGSLEIVLAPMRDRHGVAGRIVGLYQPLDAADRKAEEVGELTARLSVAAGPSARPPLALAAIDGRRIA